MLIVAPIVLLVISGLVVAMVAMVGDAIVANTRATTAYNMQDALSRIEQDARVSTNFMSTFSFLQSPQGRNGATAPFTTASGDLILTQQATDASPYNTTRNLVYYKNQPNDCAADTSGNRTLLTRTIYFLLTNTDGTKTLWRRSIVNNWNTNATPDANTVCGTPWQRDTCPVGSPVNTATCQGIDEEILDNVTSFTSTYYDSNGNTTTNQSLAVTVKVTLAVSQKSAGNTIAQNGSIEATRINDVPTVAIPSAPAVSLFNDGITSYNNPILTTIQWSAPGAQSYTVTPTINGVAQPAFTTTDTNRGFTSAPNQTVSVSVIANNDSGSSSATTFNTTSDLFTSLNLENTWECYSASFPCPSFTRTSAGVVVLRGLGKLGTGRLGVLPVGFRPNKRIIFEVMSSPHAQARVDVDTDGSIYWVTDGANPWMEFDNIRFLSSNFDSSLTWTSPVYQCPSGCTTPWSDYNGGTSGYKRVQFTKDSMGRTHMYGIATATAPYPPATYSNITTVPTSPTNYQPASGMNDIYPSNAGNNFSNISIYNGYSMFRLAGSSWQTFALMYHSATSGVAWQTPTLLNVWGNYSGYSPASYAKASDKLVTIRGLISGGTVSQGTNIFVLPSGYRPASHLVFLTAGYDSDSSPTQVPARIDVFPTGEVQIVSSNGQITNQWLSLAGINFYADGN